MSSISYLAQVRQGGKSYYVGENGLEFRLKLGKGQPSHLEGVKRGKIQCFSSGAVRRLRQALFWSTLDDSVCVGVTFTVPWKDISRERILKEFQESWHRFQIVFRRKLPNSALIYRVELQRRGAPHIHAICWGKRCDILGSGLPDECFDAAAGWLQWLFTRLWTRVAIKFYEDDEQLIKAERHAVKVDWLNSENRGALYRYLCDHASKRKQAQLGYQGKQWGIIGRDNLEREKSDVLGDFDNFHQEAVFWRMIRKLTRYRLSRDTWKKQPVFRCVFKGGRRKHGVIFIKGGGSVVQKCYEFAKSLN